MPRLARINLCTLALTLVALAAATAGPAEPAAGAPAALDFWPARVISSRLHYKYSDPTLAAGLGGRRVVAWTRSVTGRENRSYVQATEVDGEGRGGPVTNLLAGGDAGYYNDPDVAVTPSGRTVIVWGSGPDFLGLKVEAVILDESMDAGLAEVLGTGFHPAIEFSPDGDGLVAWGGSNGVSVAAVDTDGAFGAVHSVSALGFVGPPVIDFENRPKVLWAGYHGVYRSLISPTGVPGPPKQLLPPNGGGYRSPVVSGGRLVVAASGIRRGVDELICMPVSGGTPKTIARSRVPHGGSFPSIRGVDFQAGRGSRGVVGWVSTYPPGLSEPNRRGRRTAFVATVDRHCRASSARRLPSAGRARSVELGTVDGGRAAVVGGHRGVEVVSLSRDARVTASRRIRRSNKRIRRPAGVLVSDLEFLTGPGIRPLIAWRSSRAGHGRQIAVSSSR